MKILLLALVLAILPPALAQTQAEMNQEADADFKKADRKLNAAYQEVKATLDEDGAAKLKTAQKAWLAFRDAEAVLEAAPNVGGTIYPLIYASVLTRMTKARTAELLGVMDNQTTADDASLNAGDDQSRTQKGSEAPEQ